MKAVPSHWLVSFLTYCTKLRGRVLELMEFSQIKFAINLATVMISAGNLDQKLNIYDIDEVFKNEPSEICGRHPLKKLNSFGLLKAVFHKFDFIHSSIVCPRYAYLDSNSILEAIDDITSNFLVFIGFWAVWRAHFRRITYSFTVLDPWHCRKIL